MPLATKTEPARPFDVADAIRRAARCRALRQSTGYTVEELARAVGVRARSINRWESSAGEGSTPDDVLDLLQAVLDKQRELASSVADACAAPMNRGGGGLSLHPRAIDPDIIGSMIQGLIDVGSVTAARGRHKAPVKGGKMSYGAGAASSPVQPRAVKEAAISEVVKGAAIPEGAPVKGGAIPDVSAVSGVNAVTVLYYPSQSTLDAIHPNLGAPVGVVNTTARMIADELDRAGVEVEWKYASAE